MSTVVAQQKSGPNGPMIFTSLPQVNLLPPAVRAARSLRKVKRWLAIALVLVVALCAVGYGFSLFTESQAANQLTQAQNDTTRLEAQKQKYAEVPRVLSALAGATSARTLGMSTEVQWKGYLDAITAVLPDKVSIESFTVTGATPMTPAVPATNPLQGASVGQIQFTGRSATVPDTSAWIDALNSIPGFADAWVSAVTVTANSTATYYTVESKVQFTDAAFARRFAIAEGTK
jgi:Tfp pilus assembly protein PilN